VGTHRPAQVQTEIQKAHSDFTFTHGGGGCRVHGSDFLVRFGVWFGCIAVNARTQLKDRLRTEQDRCWLSSLVKQHVLKLSVSTAEEFRLNPTGFGRNALNYQIVKFMIGADT